MSRTTKIAFLIAAALVAGILCYPYLKDWGKLRNYPQEVANLFFNSSEVELFSLSPDYIKEQKSANLHGYEILGSIKLSDRGLLRRMARELDTAVDTNFMANARCFWPRHGLRAEVDGKTIELVICFECHRLLLFVDGEFQFKTDLDSSPKPSFDEPLKDAGIRIDAPVDMGG